MQNADDLAIRRYSGMTSTITIRRISATDLISGFVDIASFLLAPSLHGTTSH